jgi:hypothetical protein
VELDPSSRKGLPVLVVVVGILMLAVGALVLLWGFPRLPNR